MVPLDLSKPIPQKYQDWIDAKIAGNPKNSWNACSSWVSKMIETFPELSEVRGWIHIHCGQVEHWWCKTPDGQVIDPTAAQFLDPNNWHYQYGKEHKIIGYEEYSGPLPIGKCMICGDWCWEGESPSNAACSPDCSIALDSTYNSGKY